jgi:hypothetical protein
MAVDISELARTREGGQLQGGQDARVMQRAVIICAVALVVLVSIKVGFLQSVMP